MTSFLARTFAVLAHQPATICAVLGTSRQIMNCSAAPVLLSSDETWDLLFSEEPGSEQKLLQLFSTFSDTMQFTEKLRIQNPSIREDFIKGMLENLMNNKRYFSRTIRLLQLPSADALTEACSSQQSSTTQPHPVVLSNLSFEPLFRNLRSLTIEAFHGVPMQDEQLKTICSHCPFLEELNLPDQQQLTDEGVEFLSNLRHLETLDLQYCNKITDNGLRHLAKLSSLQTLRLVGCESTDDGLKHLATVPSLQTLNIAWCKLITDSGLQHLTKLTSLQELNLAYCDNITDRGLENLAKLSSLQSLNFYQCYNITDSGLQHLAKLTSLQSLELSCCPKITDTGLEHLTKLSLLQSLILKWCRAITDEGRRVFSQNTKVIR